MKFAGISFKNPLVIASSPLTSKIKWLIEADRHGAAAVSTKLTFIKQPFYGKLRMSTDIRHTSLICYDRRLDIDEGLRLVEQAKSKTSLKLFANITHDNEDMEGWARLAKAHEEAGADAIEANLICPNIGLSTKSIQGNVTTGEHGGAVAGQNPMMARRIVETLKESVSIPVVVKLTPNVSDIGIVAQACEAGGADGICLAGGQSALPLVDINNGNPMYPFLSGVSHGALCGPACRTMSFSQVAQVFQKTHLPVIGGGGLETGEECLMMMYWGATLVTVCTSIMWYGWEVIDRMLQDIEAFTARTGKKPEDIVGQSCSHLRSSSALTALEGYPRVNTEKCTGCGNCEKPGHCDAVTIENKKAKIDPAKCLGCGICIALCPRRAIESVIL